MACQVTKISIAVKTQRWGQNPMLLIAYEPPAAAPAGVVRARNLMPAL